MTERVYLDHSATTPADPEVVSAMKAIHEEIYGNASALHSWGREAGEALAGARQKLKA